MTDIDKLAELDDRIASADQENLEAIERLEEERNDLVNTPLEPPKIEEPPESEPQIEPPKVDPVEEGEPPEPDPLAKVRGLSAEKIDDMMNKQPMRKLIEKVTGTKPPNSKRAAELAEMIFDLTQKHS